MNKLLFRHIDNSALIVFRICFGLLCFLESVGAIATGWVHATLIKPQFTFSFIGFEWLQPLPGNWMYVYYVVMGVFGLLIMIGYKYRWSALGFAIMWTATYLMQKSSYNNHYYLLCLLSFLMVLLPAHHYASVDAKQHPEIKRTSMPFWVWLVIIMQLFVVYTYGAIAKIYPDWLNTTVIEILMESKKHYYLIGDVLQEKWMHYILSYGGILFDGLVIPLLLWKPTRKWAFAASIFFHLFNSIVFQVGIFPYLSLAFCMFFFSTKTINKLFLRRKPHYEAAEIIIPKYAGVLVTVFSIYFVIQVLLPLRHHLIEDNVLWTEEGHRMSWRMMLRTKGGSTHYRVIDTKTNMSIPIKLDDYLTKKQQRGATTKPDVIWQFAQHLKKDFASQGKDVKIYVSAYVSVNGRPFKQLINPEIDLASVPWEIFKHSDWILPSDL
ncbi:HTTM domain-containing protein [Paucihalobacter sp.]|uniref:HTTM domain-containing protein n=1 Tax=Paucihalobacter sp. TaxID=2850405 RepID=UPI002FE276F3